MSRRPPRSTRTDTRVPYTARFRSKRRRGGGRGLRRHLFVADGAAGGQGEEAEQGAGECMALHGCLPWWSGWRTARPRQWGYGEYASCAGFVPAPGAVRPERWRGVRCGAMGSGEGAMAKRAGGAVAVARGQGGLAAGMPKVFIYPFFLFHMLMFGISG